jgi:hypothetical protein
MSNRLVRDLTAMLSLLLVAGSLAAESQPAATTTDQTGWTSYLEFAGTSNTEGQVYELQSSVGYSFTQHFGMDFGLPVYFVNASSKTTGGSSETGIGNPSVDLRWKYLNPALNYGSVLVGSAPVGNSKLGLSTGRATFDWTNRFDRSFSPVTPFVEGGLSNTIYDTRLFVRPYTTLGLNTHVQGGASVDVTKHFSLGASLYDILPFGDQTVFSRITGSGNATATTHGRSFQSQQQTTGSAAIARDNGFSTFVDLTPNAIIDAELGFTRSVHYDLNSVSFSVGFNMGRWLRKRQ